VARNHDNESVVLTRTDVSKETHQYPIAEIDRRTRQNVTGNRAYLKARYRASLQTPRNKKNSPLYLHPAPAYPQLSCACLIVEGESDATFFRGILDRLQPGWQYLRCESHRDRPVIEVRVSGGADRLGATYKRARSDGFFHTADPSLDAGGERIIVVVDEDHAEVFRKTHEDVSRARHRVVLRPDVERIAPEALLAALGLVRGRPLDLADRRAVKELLSLSGHDFESAVFRRWGIYLKRSDPRHASAFANHLATTFPMAGQGQASDRVWQACERLFRLATCCAQMSPLAAF
jgi:hypothetical protein